MKDRTIIHIDMDAFYASVEQKDNPAIRGKPVIVGALPKSGTGRGVVSAASYEAREYGIHSAQPISKAYRLCPQGVFLPVRGERYAEISSRIMSIFREYTPLVQPLSLDEAFLDMTGTERLRGNTRDCGLEMKQRILEELFLTASVGIGPNKLIAKIASDLEKPDGFVVVHRDEVQSFLEPLPVSRLWGIGKQTESALHKLGIRTIGQLSRFSERSLNANFGKMGESLIQYSRGIDSTPVLSNRERKSISHEVTYSQDKDDMELFHRTLLRLAEKVGYRLRKKSMQARTVTLKILLADYYTTVRHATLPETTSLDNVIYETVLDLFKKVDRKEQSIRLLGVGVTHIEKEEKKGQTDLFGRNDEKTTRATRAVDQLRQRYGENVIRKASTATKRKSATVSLPRYHL